MPTTVFSKTLNDTPTKPKSTQTGRYHTGDLATRRAAVLEDIGFVAQICSLETAKKYILPSVPHIDIPKTQKVLEDRKIVGKAGWAGFPRPSTNNAREEAAFFPLKNVYQKIIDNIQFQGDQAYASAPRYPTLEYIPCGAFTPLSERDNSSRPDGFGSLTATQPESMSYIATAGGREIKGRAHWDDIAFADEYKKEDNESNRRDNWSKVIWSMHHIMRNDPRRRFTFGITIEDTRTRVWLCSRQCVVATQSFDFMKNYDLFIYVALSLFFATTVQLGWDQTFKLCKNIATFEYDITVHYREGEEIKHKVYRTQKVLSNYAADSIRGRATRVYEAVPINSDGKTIGEKVTIKDFWIDWDRPREGKILEGICAGLDSEDRKYFPTAVVYGDVLINDEPDNTETTIMRGLKLEDDDTQVISKEDGEGEGKDKDEVEEEEDVDEDRVEEDLFLEPRPAASAITDGDQVSTPNADGLSGTTNPTEPAPAEADPEVKYLLINSGKSSHKPPTNASVGILTGADEPPNTDQVAILNLDAKNHHRVVFAEVGKTVDSLVKTDSTTTMNVVLRICLDVIKALEIMYRGGYVHRDVSPNNILTINSRGILIDHEYAKKMGAKREHSVRTGSWHFTSREVSRGSYRHLKLPKHSERVKLIIPKTIHNPLHDLEPDKDTSIEELDFHESLRSFEESFCEHPLEKLVEHLEVFRTKLLEAYNIAEKPLSTGGEIDTQAFSHIHADISEILEKATKEEAHNMPLCSVVELSKARKDGTPSGQKRKNSLNTVILADATSAKRYRAAY